MSNARKRKALIVKALTGFLALAVLCSAFGCRGSEEKPDEPGTAERDTTAPKIECKDTEVIEGTALNIEELISVSDDQTENISYSYKISPEIKDEEKLEIGEYEVTVTAIDASQNITSEKFKLTVKIDEVAAAKKKAEEEAKKKAEEEAKKKEEEERAKREAEEAAAAQAAAQQQQQPVYTPPVQTPVYSEPDYQCWDGSWAYDASGCPATPASGGGGGSTSHGTQYFMFSDGYDFDSGYNACVAAGAAHGSYSCQPIQNSDGIYTGYQLSW